MPVLIAYATHQGHTRVIAEYVAAALRVRDVETEVVDVADPPPLDLTEYDAVVLAASVHLGRHQKEMVRFVKVFREELAVRPTAFLSVSMSETTAANDNNTTEARAEAAERVAEQVESFFDETEWTADHVQPVAGALMYSEYGLVTRFVMKMIAKSTGAATDTSRDHVYTDFAALERFASKLCDTVRAH